MPKIIDREARRQEIVEKYLALVAREGIEASTTRRLAQELGVATGALWHYFSNFDEVLLQAFQLVFHRTDQRIAESTEGLSGLAALVAMLRQILPLEKDTFDEAQVVTSFWGRIAAHPSVGARQAFFEKQWREECGDHLERARRDGELLENAPVPELADVLSVLGMGYQVEYVLDTPLAAVERQWAAVRAVLGPWMTETGRSRAGLERLAVGAAAE